MLPKTHRLLSDKDFQATWKRGRSFYTKILGFKVLENRLAVSRFGIVVGNKISKKSTDRNRLKRQLREILQAKIGKISRATTWSSRRYPPPWANRTRSWKKN